MRNLKEDKAVDENRTVFIKKIDNGFQLIRNGNPFYIQGASGNSHFKELSLIGGNTIRLYDTINLANFLNEAESCGLAVIVDIPIPKYNKKNNWYLVENNNHILKQKVKVLVKRYKSHPALLMWNLGNELFYPFVFKKNSFINTFNELIDIIHYEDPNHPVSTALAGVSRQAIPSIYIHSPKLDLLSFNMFGNIKGINYNLAQISSLFGVTPYFVSEMGSDGEWESQLTSWMAPIEQTSTKKAEQIKKRYKIIADNKDGGCLGSLVFFWGKKHELTYTWFSLFMDDFKSEIIKELENLWKKSNTNSTLIGLDYMLLDGKGAADNIIFAPNELKTAEIKFNTFKNYNIRIEWEIYPDVWCQAWYENTYNRPVNPQRMGSFIYFEKNKVTFYTPKEEGPYRIFAYIYDKNGYFATTNTPFYVLNTK
ncbi:MAG: hypothetical protein JZU47_22405 [Prolixibacteraceae bacterium]|nr:hypothetical protein [Prolixibacteraceae bacterium]